MPPQCYGTLGDGVKNSFLITASLISCLIVCDIYCVIIIAIGRYIWLPIPILIFDLLATIGLLCRLWYLVYTNDDTCTADGCFYAGLYTFCYFGGCIGSVGIYMGQVFSNTKELIVQEFIIIVPYLVISSITIVWLTGAGIWYIFNLIKDTYKKVNERNTNAGIHDKKEKPDTAPEWTDQSVELDLPTPKPGYINV